MKYYFAFILIFFSSTLLAQTIDEQKMILNTISNYNEKGIIPYITKPYDYDLLKNLDNRLLELSRKNFREIKKESKKRNLSSISFSQIDSLTFIELNESSVFNYLQRIKEEKINIRRSLQEQNDLITLQKLDNKMFHYVYFFGEPIYFNKKQSCLIQTAEYCGGCGVTKISIFKKNGNKWALIISKIIGEF